jgi:hypothetical protein
MILFELLTFSFEFVEIQATKLPCGRMQPLQRCQCRTIQKRPFKQQR